jgi:hypothetical protein
MGADVGLCPSPRQLERLLAEQLGDPERASVEAHVEQCPTCQGTLDRLVGAPPAPSASRAGGRPEDSQAEPGGDFLDRLKQRPPQREASHTAAADWLVGGRLGQYEVLGALGKGGMGAVYKARHVELGKVVALKVLPAERVCEANVARFRHEVRAMGKLEHPNIVAAYDAGEHRGVRYLVMALVDGVDLGELVERRGPLPIADACELARQAATGLQHAFERGLVHRDVKPQNLMLASDGTVKVLDLGLARSFGDAPAETLTAAGSMLGTADYLAPEQWDSPHAADTRADVYALGCTLYHLVAGRPPFAAYRSILMKMQAHQEVPPPPVTDLRPDAPAGLAAVLDRMLAKSPGDRYATPAEAAEALRPFAAGADLVRLLGTDRAAAGAATPAAAATPGPAALKTTLSRGRRGRPSPARRYAVRVAVAAVALLALAASLLWPGSGARTGPAAKPLAVTEMRVIHYRDKGAERLGELRTSTVAVRLNDNVEVAAELSAPAHCYLIAFNPEGSEGGTEQLCYPESADGKEAKTIRPDKTKEIRYPRKDAFVLDAAGLQVFVLAASMKPLPPYEEWRSKAGAIPWKGAKDGSKDRWHFDGREFTRYRQQQRARVEPMDGPPKPLQELCDWFKGREEFEAVHVFAFPVTDGRK